MLLPQAATWRFSEQYQLSVMPDSGVTELAMTSGRSRMIAMPFMVLQLIWVKTMVPETKGVPLEQMQKQLGIK